jgi:CRISPR/Cas system CSM-associated protein Csm5 (group 7 of RAMP superfamily)
MKMKGKTLSLKIGLEILTPVQCGSGQDLTEDIDYVVENGQVFVIDQERTFTAIASGDRQLDDALLGGERKLSYWVNLARERYGYALPMLSRTTKTFGKFREHLKDALYQPYIAGSSLKGAITTALLADYLRNKTETFYAPLLPMDALKTKPTASKNYAAQKLLAELLGKDPKNNHDAKDNISPNNNIFRALLIKDALFKSEHLCLADIRWLNLTKRAGKEQACWRSMATRESVVDWHKAEGIHAEMLKPQSQAQFQLQWDEFLLSDLSEWHSSAHDILPRDFAGLKERLNRHASYRLEQEIKFYHDHGAIKPEQKCKNLLSALQKDPDSIYLQLSWGSGWRGMTGDWLGADLTKATCRLFNLRNPVLPELPFPKTRRLAVSGEPKLPLGWVRLFPYSQIEEKLKQEQLEIAKKLRDEQEIESRKQQRLASLSPVERELEDFLTGIPQQEWDTRLLRELEKSRWTGEEAKQVALKVKELMINADKWRPDFTGTNKSKVSQKERSLKVLAYINN